MFRILLELTIDIKLKQILPNYNKLNVDKKYLQPLVKGLNISRKIGILNVQRCKTKHTVSIGFISE